MVYIPLYIPLIYIPIIYIPVIFKDLGSPSIATHTPEVPTGYSKNSIQSIQNRIVYSIVYSKNSTVSWEKKGPGELEHQRYHADRHEPKHHNPHVL